LSQTFNNHNNIEIIRSDINGGYSYGNNLGSNKAIHEGADAILIINPDVVLVNNAIDLMYSSLLVEQKISVVVPRIFDTYNIDNQFASKLLTFKNFFFSKKPLVYLKTKRENLLRYYNYNHCEDFYFSGMGSGCCFMIKSGDFKIINLLDSKIFLFYEEDIIAYRLFFINKLTKFLSKAEVMHNHSTSVNKEGEAFVRFHRYISSQYVLKKYAGISDFQFFCASFIHLVPFSYNAILHKSYRKLYFLFVKKLFSLYIEN
jgi:GT2 family glycosyltransferase